MSINWCGASEIVAGLIVSGRISINAVRPEIFMPPYDGLIREMKNGITAPEDLMERVGLDTYQTVLHAVENMNGIGKANWVGILENTLALYNAGQKLEKYSKKLLRGDDIDWAELQQISRQAQTKLAESLTPLSEIKRGELPFISSGWPVLDEHTGGIPEVGLITIGGQPGVGKTSLLTRLVGGFAKEHKTKKVVVFSLEMVLSEIAKRFDEVELLSQEVQGRIILDEIPCTPDEVLTKASMVDHLGLIAVDFSDLMIKGETTESAMAHIYRTLMLGAKTLHVPILLLSQLSRKDGGLPKPHWLRYSGLAEALSWMILMLYDPSRDWNTSDKEDEKDPPLPIIDNASYIIVWKIRGGFRKHLDECPGAICVPFKGSKGWHPTRSKWYSLKKYA